MGLSDLIRKLMEIQDRQTRAYMTGESDIEPNQMIVHVMGFQSSSEVTDVTVGGMTVFISYEG